MKIRQAKKIIKRQFIDYSAHRTSKYWVKPWLEHWKYVLEIDTDVKLHYRIKKAITRIVQYRYKLTKSKNYANN